jgi:hypothetical protein
VTIYQEANAVVSTVTTPTATLEFDYSGSMFPGDGGVFAVLATSFATTTTTYTSGAEEVVNEPYAADITTTNVESTSVSTVSGQTAFYITLGRGGSAARWVFVRLRDPNTNQTLVSISKRQEAYVAKEASFTAVVWPGGMPYTKGRVCYNFSVTSGSLTGATLTEVVLHYILNGGSETTVNVGSMSLQDMGGTALAELSSSPTFASGSTVESWFSATSIGGFDSISYPHTTTTVQ